MDQAYEQRLGAKLAAIEELRLELGSEGIECPGVLVVGAQSAGKSSVLERLTGIDFPRAENTCTRVPTIVQLQTNPKMKEPKATISKDSRLQENAIECRTMGEIRDAILNLTAEMVDETTSIRDEPIHIRYVRNKGPVMTLIDLPGITHVDVKNEGFDIHQVTAAMVRRYVDNENMIVLVVIPANDDFGNSEALRIAQTFDKEGNRTIGVVSKCDLVPEKSDIVQKIQMTRDGDVKLALGFIAVRNKGSEEEGIDILAAEHELFRKHPLLKQLKEHERGYQALSKKIVDLQSDRVSRFIPEAKVMVRSKIEEIKKDLERMGHSPSTHSDRNILLTKELCDMDAAICRSIRAESGKDVSTNIAARTYELSLEFAQAVRVKVPDCLGAEYNEKLMQATKETRGYSLPNFISDQIFRDSMTEIFFVDNLAPNTDVFIDDVADLMIHVLDKIIHDRKTMKQFPKLATALLDECRQGVRRAQERAKRVTGVIIDAERVQVYSQNSHYIDTIGKTQQNILATHKKGLVTEWGDALGISETQRKVVANLSRDKPSTVADGINEAFISQFAKAIDSDDEQKAVMELQISIHCYADTVMRRQFDVIPMIVRSVMVHELQKQFHYTMRASFDEEALENVCAEDGAAQREREQLQTRMARMRAARKKLNALR